MLSPITGKEVNTLIVMHMHNVLPVAVQLKVIYRVAASLCSANSSVCVILMVCHFNCHAGGELLSPDSALGNEVEQQMVLL